jgi:Lon protease-like protein
LPLHIFEDRYKEMIGEAIRDQSEFGVVLATEKGIANTGCSAAVDQVLKRYPDGRMDILTAGRRRFEINLLNEDRPFLRADIYFYGDEDDAAAPAEMRRLVAQFGKQLDSGASFDDNDPQLSFQVGQRLPDLEMKQVLLAMRSEADRIRHLAQFIPGFLGQQKLTQHIRAVAPKNGHSTHLRDHD